jgi:hypothetical protein
MDYSAATTSPQASRLSRGHSWQGSSQPFKTSHWLTLRGLDTSKLKHQSMQPFMLISLVLNE